ncbi:zinc carboxypeptidase domain-containing protein [Ditylenchus destructor]|uniref:Zinc carboxypeptidase domain-containing protein n=1 Tax=Ditylenchus destructor TaxID=166010 RepID=A0AAD4MMK5_9BILA|nr:zinc carboxypeptidase domain-containing protein [Ditylenchus destructor]
MIMNISDIELFGVNCFHAREWIAPAVALQFINHLTREEYKGLLEDIDIYVLPLLNPDGYEYSREVDRMWRKTRSGPRNGCYGADPNRNFPYHWCTTGASHQPCSYQDYCGMKPLSEVECQNLANFLIRNKNTILAYITLHSYGNMIIHPFGDKMNSYPRNVAELKRVGERATAAIANAGGPNYLLGTTMEVIRYTASGASDDFAKSIGIRYSYTMELTDSVYGFLLPSKYINNTARHVIPALMVFAEEVQTIAAQGLQS